MSLVQKLRSLVSNGIVLAFHDIQPDRLSKLVDSIHPAKIISLTEILERSKQGKSTRGLFAITVDDGVGETVRNLSQLFLTRGWPGTFYLPTNYVDSKEGIGFQWWRNLIPFLPHKRLQLKNGVVDLSQPGALRALSRKMEAMWHAQKIGAYLPFTLELAEVALQEHGLGLDAIKPPDPISWQEVAELSREDLLRFESHGASHTAMAALTDEELIVEMKHSRNLVSEHTGRRCRHLAYPFGSDQSIGHRAPIIAGKFYDSATTMTLGSVDAANPWLLPRIPLYPENSTWVANLKILVKYNRMKGLSGTRGSQFAAAPRARLCFSEDRQSNGGSSHKA